MDLMQLTNTLKDLSDQQLAAVQQSAQVPPYVVVGEMQRRVEMRKEYAASQDQHQPSVASQLAAKFAASQAPPQPQGGPPPGMQAPPGGIMGGAPAPGPQMAQGGIISLAGGGTADYRGAFSPGDDDAARAMLQQIAAQRQNTTPSDPPDPASNPALTAQEMDARYPVPTMANVLAQVQAMRGTDQMAPIAAELAQESAKARHRKISPWEAISRAGFAMAAAPTSSFGAALGAAGIAGLNNVSEQRDQNQKDYVDFLRNRMLVAQAQQTSQDRDMGAAAELYRSGTARADTLAGILEPSKRLDLEYRQDAPIRKANLETQQQAIANHKLQAKLTETQIQQISQKDDVGHRADILAVTHPELSESERMVRANEEHLSAVAKISSSVEVAKIKALTAAAGGGGATRPPTIPAGDPNSPELMGQTGLGLNGFTWLTDPGSLSKDKATRTAASAEAQAWAKARGVDVATIRSEYKAQTNVLRSNIERYNRTRIMEGEVLGTIDNLQDVVKGLSRARLANVAEIWAGREANSNLPQQYIVHLKQLRSQLAGFNAATQGRSGGDLTISDNNEAEKIIMDGIAKGSLDGVSTAIRNEAGKMKTVMGQNIDNTHKSVWDLFGVGQNYKPKFGTQVAAPAAGGVPSVSTKADYDNLPSGSTYIDAQDGKQYKKR